MILWLKVPILLCTEDLPNPDRQFLWQFCNGLPYFAVFHNFVWFCLNLETCSRLGLWIHEQWCLVKSFDLQKRISLSPKIGKEISWPSIKIYELEDCEGWLISKELWFNSSKKRTKNFDHCCFWNAHLNCLSTRYDLTTFSDTKLLLDSGDFHSNPSWLLSFK